MAQPVIQTSFGAGEISPSLWGQVDLTKYHSGAALLRNFFVDYRGGAVSRMGTQFIGQCKVSSKACRLIPFTFSTLQTYMLEFGDAYIRVIKNGGYVLEAAKTITGITRASPGVVTSNAHGFSNGDTVDLDSIVGMTQLNGKTFTVAGVTANTFTLVDMFGVAVDTTAYTAYSSGGTASRWYTITTPYAAADLALLKFAQDKDTMTLTHPGYVSKALTRSGDAAWTLSSITFATSMAAPTSPGTTPLPAAGPTTFTTTYVVTALDANLYEESIATSPVSCANAALNQTTGVVNVINWTASAGAGGYKVYKALTYPTVGGAAGTQYGYIGTTTGVSFTDANIAPDYTQGPPAHKDPFAAANYPGTVCYFQQRKTFGGSTSLPDTVWATQTALYSNMDVHNPVRSDDALTLALNSQQVNAIKAMVPMASGLIILTSNGAWQLLGSGSSSLNPVAITPSDAVAEPQAYNGCNDMPPIVVNYDILFVQAKNAVVRDLSYNFYVNVYTGNDMTVLANHLFFGKNLLEWAWAEEPYKTAWVVRDDGQLLSFAYLKEQNVYAWAHHDTNGLFKSVGSVTETVDTGKLDSVYVIVKRYVQGQWLQYVERFDHRVLKGDIENAWCVDAGLQWPMSTPAANLIASGATGTITVTADAAVFDSADVTAGKVIRLGGGKGTVIAYTSTTVITVKLTNPITAVLQNDPSSTPAPISSGHWTYTTPTTTVNGLEHLEGKTVAVLGDGNVLSPKVVSGGSVTLEAACSQVVVGLPYQCQLQTLQLDTGEPTTQGKRKKISALTVRAQEARGLKMGRSFATVVPFKERTTQLYGRPVPLQSIDMRIVMDPLWDVPGQVCIQIDDPVPATVLAVIPEVTMGDTP